MEFRLLGELEIEAAAGLVRLSGRKQQSLLTLLLLHNGELLSRDFLIDQLWERPPADPVHALEGQVSRLRKALRALEGAAEPIARRPGGYVLRVEPEQVDLGRAERLIAEGRQARTAGDEQTAVERLTAALALWRGKPLADLTFEPFALVELHRLEELRLGAVEELAEAQLAIGRHGELIPELEALLARHPLRERLRGELMLALYRAGRQADALECYRQGRQLLVDELGIDPSGELQRLQQQILNHDPALDPPTSAARPPPQPPPPVRPPSASVVTAGPAREQRKVVTVLFCDLSDSTALGDELDPEALRVLLARYFERTKAIIEHHGGTVEKFIGDAVMAVFGVPLLHEDDALRACRAALEMQEALPSLGVTGSVGVATGEVVTGTEERLATGAAVNLAARLEQAAQPGAVLIAGETLRLAGAAVEVEPVGPLELKGKSEPVAAYRLLSISEAPGRSDESRFVGRERELGGIREAWERARSERCCELVTIVGEAGVGKSRLVAEAVAALEARMVSARCLPYGDGITYWPVVEVVEQLKARPADPAAEAALASLLGETGQATSAEEIGWAFRKLLEQEAPLVVVFDDIQWGEQTFLDLVEQIGVLSSGAPLLLLCVARPELVERRPQWPAALRLGPLAEEEVDELIGERAPEALREQIVRAAGGNPLFVLEMLAMAEQAAGEVVVPATLRALLAARIDQLDAAERLVLECGSIEGEIFHRGGVQALAEELPVTARLVSLARKELIRPDKALLAGEDGFRFRHLLLRDAVYDGLPKARRAELHERFAGWLEKRGAELVELDEILGYHLEHAARYGDELGQPDASLAERAGERLAAAGRRALSRDNLRAAASLMERALALTRPTRLDVALEADLAGALALDDPAHAAAIADAAAGRARAAGDRAGEAHARVVCAHYRAWAGELGGEELERIARAALPLLEHAGDHAGLAEVWEVLFTVGNMHGRWEEADAAIEQAIHHARLAGRKQADLLDWAATALLWGPWPAEEALRQIAERVPEPQSPYVRGTRALLLARLGRFDEAWPTATDACARLNEQSGFPGEILLGRIAMDEGDYEAAVQYLEIARDTLHAEGNYSFLSSFAQVLGRSLCAVGRHDEAEQLVPFGRDLAAPDDVGAQMLWRQVQALVHGHRREHAEAERLAREAVQLGEQTDAPNWRGDALCDLAEVLQAAGRTDEAVEALEQALERYESTNNLAMVAQIRPRLEALRQTSLA